MKLVVKFAKINVRKLMKTRIIALVLVVASTLFSCKNDKAETNKEAAVAETPNNQFKFTLNVIAKSEDDFCLLYTQDGSTNFKDEVVWQHVKGNPNEQQVVFVLPADTYPTQLRFDLGIKKEQEDIILKSVVCEYKGKKKEIYGSELGLLFRPDESKCTFDPTTGVIKAIVKDGLKQIPSMYPQETNLGPVLKKLAE